MNHLKLWYVWFKMTLAREMTYKANFFLRVISFVIFSIVSPIVATIIYSVSSGIPGWDFSEFLLFIGIFTLIHGVNRFLFFDLPFVMSWNVQEGVFDTQLLRPGKTLLYMLSQCVDIDGLTQIFVGIGITIFALIKLGAIIHIYSFLAFIMTLLFGLLFLLSISIIAATTSFFSVKSYSIMDLFSHATDLGKYPISIYGATGAFVLTFLVPFGLSAYYPASALLGRIGIFYLIRIGVVCFGFFLLSLAYWNFGLSKYSSAGG